MAKKRSVLGRVWRTVLGAILLLALCSVSSVLTFRWINPPISSFMIEAWVDAKRHGDRLFTLQHRWVDLDHISPHLALAVVASEDQKFPEHWGFDVAAIENAYALNKRSHKLRGASTISQQTAKNLFLWSGRSYFRKGLEAYFTILTETLWPKKRILEMYLNFAQFGNGVFGAEAAAQKFFHKPAADLTRSDAALLAAVLPSPEKLHAAAPSAYVERRRGWILAQMRDLGGPEMLDEIDSLPARNRR